MRFANQGVTKMAEIKTGDVTHNITIPFTGGLIVFVYAFFWPEGFGHWLGTIVHSFRAAAGF
jgi:hypothetical protein